MPRKTKLEEDPHHCKCFSISKKDFQDFVTKLQNFGYTEPILEEDHGQIIGFTKPNSRDYQIHVKLLRTGRIEAEVEYSANRPFAHLNPVHSYSAHKELQVLLWVFKIPHKCKTKPPLTCIRPIVIPAKDPIKLDSVLAIGGLASLADLIFNDGKITSVVAEAFLKEFNKNLKRKKRRKKYLN